MLYDHLTIYPKCIVLRHWGQNNLCECGNQTLATLRRTCESFFWFSELSWTAKRKCLTDRKKRRHVTRSEWRDLRGRAVQRETERERERERGRDRAIFSTNFVEPIKDRMKNDFLLLRVINLHALYLSSKFKAKRLRESRAGGHLRDSRNLSPTK